MELSRTYGQRLLLNQFLKILNKDLYVPLHYRGTTLLSVVGKLYTSLLSHRLNLFIFKHPTLFSYTFIAPNLSKGMLLHFYIQILLNKKDKKEILSV